MKKNFLIFIDFARKLVKSRSMIKTMAVRELKARYVGSTFGFLWAVLNPLSEVIIYGIVFGVFFKSKPDPVYGTDSFILFLLCGLIPWQFFSQAVLSSSGALVANGNLVKKAVGFPSEILPIISVISNVISHLISLGLLLVLLVFVGKFTPYILLIFVYMFFAAVLAVGLGWLLSSINVFLRDVQQVLGLIIMALFFFTPIFYSPAVFPKSVLPLVRLNPMYHVVDGYKLALMTGKSIPLPDLAYLAISSFFILGIGGAFFRRLKPSFAEVL